MRKQLPQHIERGRIPEAVLGIDVDNPSKPGDLFGLFAARRGNDLLVIICSDASDPVCEGWEHVTVMNVKAGGPDGPDRCATWDEMCAVKSWFWEPEECVVQFHPPESDYVSVAPHALHLWRHREIIFPRPPTHLVGSKKREESA
jgi:hypothetical protein